MNNRNINQVNSFPNLRAWCEKFHADGGVKVHPTSVPTDLVLEDLLGYVAVLVNNAQEMLIYHDALVKRVVELEQRLAELIKPTEIDIQTMQPVQKKGKK